MSVDAGHEDARSAVSVAPADALRDRERLFSALEQAFSVRFVAGAPAASDGAAMSVVAAGRSLHLFAGRCADRPSQLSFASVDSLDPSLRGATLTEAEGPLDSLAGQTGDVLASAEEGPMWIRRGDEDLAALLPAELEPGTALREHLRGGRFFALLPLIQFLRTVAPPTWAQPPLRATFVFDDPNLHWSSYGFIRYRELARHASAHGYTATMAIIPRDLWYAYPSAVRVFRESCSRLSLAMHGNDHVKRELNSNLPIDDRRALIAQAVRRAARFESRWAMPIARVMIPPHGSTARDMALEMPRLGIEAMSDSRPYPWLTRPPADATLAGWRFVDVVDGGLPVIPRYHFTRSRDDLPLRALLGQPLVLYGHHDDVAGGLDMLAQAAAQVNALGDVRWCSLGEIAQSNFETRRTDSLLELRLSAPVVDLDVPDGVSELVVSAPLLAAVRTVEAAGRLDVVQMPVSNGSTDAFPVQPGRLRLRAVREDAIDESAIQAPRLRPWPILRRGAGEARDRVLPVAARVRRT